MMIPGYEDDCRHSVMALFILDLHE